MIESWNDFYARSRVEIQWPELEKELDAFMHAIGRVSLEWNALEELFFTYLTFSKVPNGVARYLGFKMNNNDKMEVMQVLAEEFETGDPDSYERARTFFRYARICTDNRNFLMHSIITGPDELVFSLRKKSRNSVGNYVIAKFGLTEVRQMAQDIANTTQFAGRLQMVMFSFPQRLAQTADGQILAVPLLDPPPEPINWQSFKVDA
ncbi:hypothetical protein SPB21_12310 [Leptothoe sp. ISB3NOV94-8A]